MHILERLKYETGGLVLGHDHHDPIEWRYVIEGTVWPKIFRACWKKSGFRGRWNPEQFGIAPGTENFQVIPLHLLLSDNDWAVLFRKTRNGYCLLDERHVVKLHGNFLFFLDQQDGQCREILRFALVEDAMVAVELLLDLENPVHTLSHTALTVGLFSDILPGRHFTYYSEAYETGEFECRDELHESGHDWFWRRPDDPRCYPPKPQPWYAMHPERCRLGAEKPEWVNLSLRNDQGQDLGPPRWSKAEIGLLARDPNLCSRGAALEFSFLCSEVTGQEGALQMFEGGLWQFTVPFKEVADGFVSPRARVNRKCLLFTRSDPDPDDISKAIWRIISRLIQQKIEFYEKNRRQHRRIVTKFLGYE